MIFKLFTRRASIRSPERAFTKRYLTNVYIHKKKTVWRHIKGNLIFMTSQVAIPCRPAKTFTIYVLDVPEEIPEDDIRHALYKYRSIVEVTRLPLNTTTIRK